MAQRKSSTKTKKKEKKVIDPRDHVHPLDLQQYHHHHHRPRRQGADLGLGRHGGFKGSRKSTPFAAQLAAEKALKDAENFGLRTLDVRVKGPGAGRESAIRSIGGTPLQVRSIKDVTPDPA